MNINQFANSKAGMIVAAGVVVAALSYVAAREAKKAISEVGDAIDITDRSNIFYSGVSAVGESLTGEKTWSLGGWIYDITN